MKLQGIRQSVINLSLVILPSAPSTSSFNGNLLQGKCGCTHYVGRADHVSGVHISGMDVVCGLGNIYSFVADHLEAICL